jgi:hypothetical protein
VKGGEGEERNGVGYLNDDLHKLCKLLNGPVGFDKLLSDISVRQKSFKEMRVRNFGNRKLDFLRY